MSEVDTVVLDVGGVLRDSRRLMSHAIRTAYSSDDDNGDIMPLSDEFLQNLWSLRGTETINSLRTAFRLIECSKGDENYIKQILKAEDGSLRSIDDVEKRAKDILDTATCDADLVEHRVVTYRREFAADHNSALVTEIGDLKTNFERLQKSGRRIFICSNSSLKSIERDLKPYRSYFAGIIYRAAKPNVEKLFAAFPNHAEEFTRAVFVGDALSDWNTAQSAGFGLFCGVASGMAPRQWFEERAGEAVECRLEVFSSFDEVVDRIIE